MIELDYVSQKPNTKNFIIHFLKNFIIHSNNEAVRFLIQSIQSKSGINFRFSGGNTTHFFHAVNETYYNDDDTKTINVHWRFDCSIFIQGVSRNKPA